MVELELPAADAERLARYLRSPGTGTPRTDHWRHFGAMNRITVDAARGAVTVSAGAGFDSEYELSFRPRSAREAGGLLWRRLTGRDPTARYAAAFSAIWKNTPPVSLETAASVLGAPLTAHKILACHYACLLLPHLPTRGHLTYLEIGPGSGYLAALVHHLRPGPVILIDLPDILPFSFLTLQRIFPAQARLLPNEIDGARDAIAHDGIVFLTGDQAAAVPDACADLAVNTASFGEMLPQQVSSYFALLRRARRPQGLFFTSNRVEKWMKPPGGAPGTEIAMRFEDYPWSPRDEILFHHASRFHALVQPENPVLNRLCRLAGPAP